MVEKNVLLEQVRPEMRLMLKCARPRVESDTAQSIRSLLRENIDWKLLLRSAWQHGVTALVYSGLKSAAAEAVPSSVLDDIRAQVGALTARAALQTKELLTLLALFEAS